VTSERLCEREREKKPTTLGRPEARRDYCGRREKNKEGEMREKGMETKTNGGCEGPSHNTFRVRVFTNKKEREEKKREQILPGEVEDGCGKCAGGGWSVFRRKSQQD